MYNKKDIFTIILFVSLFVFNTNSSEAAQVSWSNWWTTTKNTRVSSATVTTDKDNYYPGEVIILTGYAAKTSLVAADNRYVVLGTIRGGTCKGSHCNNYITNMICTGLNFCAGTLSLNAPQRLGPNYILLRTCWDPNGPCTDSSIMVNIIQTPTPTPTPTPPVVNIRFQ